MILPIYTYGQSVLKKEAEEIDENYEGREQLIKDMFETLRKSEGVGLAAPQIGLSIRLAVVDLDIISDDQPEFKGYFRTYINPYIEETDGATVPYEEGCLSFPDLGAPLKRAAEVTVQYIDAAGLPQSATVRGFLSRAVQHETDHLKGILYVDRLEDADRAKIEKKIVALCRKNGGCA